MAIFRRLAQGQIFFWPLRLKFFDIEYVIIVLLFILQENPC